MVNGVFVMETMEGLQLLVKRGQGFDQKNEWLREGGKPDHWRRGVNELRLLIGDSSMNILNQEL